MRRAGVIAISLMILTAFISGCKEDTVTVADTGFELRFTDCLVSGVWVFIDGEYQDLASTEQPQFFPLPAGTYTYYMRTNAYLDDVFGCWSGDVRVKDGEMTILTLSCDGAECSYD